MIRSKEIPGIRIVLLDLAAIKDPLRLSFNVKVNRCLISKGVGLDDLNSLVSRGRSLCSEEKSIMVFGPTPMRRLYLAVPIEYEDNLLSKIGEMGVVQLIREFSTKRPEKARVLDVFNGHLKHLPSASLRLTC